MGRRAVQKLENRANEKKMKKKAIKIIIIIIILIIITKNLYCATKCRWKLSNRETRNETSVSSTYSTKKLSYHVSFWEGSSFVQGVPCSRG